MNFQMSTQKKKKIIIIGLTIVELIRLIIDLIFPSNLPSVFDQSFIELFLPVIVYHPILEELIFRGLLIGLFNLLVIFFLSAVSVNFRKLNVRCRSNNFPNILEFNSEKYAIHRVLECILVVVSAILFAFSHLSDWGEQTFYYYFLGGIIYGIIFLRYGFFSSVLWHMIRNFVGSLFIKLALMDLLFTIIIFVLFMLYIMFFELRNEVWNRFIEFWKKHRKFLLPIWFIISLIASINYGINQDSSDITLTMLLVGFLGLLIIVEYVIVERKELTPSNLYGLLQEEGHKTE